MEIESKKKGKRTVNKYSFIDSEVKKQDKKINHLASPLMRGLAFLTDSIFVLVYYFYFFRPDFIANPVIFKVDYFLLINTYLVLVALPEALFSLGLGKLIFKLRIQNQGEVTGSFGRLLMRSFVFRLTPFLIFPLYKLFSKKELFYDKMLNLYVVKDKK